ncbi:hypothetical protein BST29_19275 [Mycobacterium malmoense]|uniref:PE domain-containing protein n=1 Tax=Mycobacterium malmoense TaxID=1780 RepID=A0ABX3SMF3_MYCMA|nr:hypothetical protein BST29_19275 [Mycobacterium malmoense]
MHAFQGGTQSAGVDGRGGGGINAVGDGLEGACMNALEGGGAGVDAVGNAFERGRMNTFESGRAGTEAIQSGRGACSNTFKSRGARVNTVKGGLAGSSDHRLNDGVDDHVQHARTGRRCGGEGGYCGGQKCASGRAHADDAAAAVAGLGVVGAAVSPHAVLCAFQFASLP